ncbi:hypothetical protein HDU76_003246 [Blyttiomyces sp. JEL0837]|nr:hypothetical protein HDU76_003246 [Blyttiomyces sp. JEL0837]
MDQGRVYYDDNNDVLRGGWISEKSLIDTVLNYLGVNGVNKITSSFLERYLAYGGSLSFAIELLLINRATTQDLNLVLDVLVNAGFHIGIRDAVSQHHYELLQFLIQIDANMTNTKEIDRHHQTTFNLIGKTLLTNLEVSISDSKASIICEHCLIDCLDWLHTFNYLKLITIPGFLELLMNKALQANYTALFQQTVRLFHESGVTDINFTGFERILAAGGDFKFSAVWLNRINEVPYVKEILEIHVRAGFHIAVANDGVVKALHDMLVNDHLDIIDYLWDLGALDSFEFGRRVVQLIEENEIAINEEDKVRVFEWKKIESANARRGWYCLDLGRSMFSGVVWRKVVLDLLPAGSNMRDWEWNLETVIISAVYLKQLPLLRHLHKTGIDINETVGSKLLVLSTAKSPEDISFYLVAHANVIPSNDHLPSIITNFYQTSQFQVLQKLIDLGCIPTTMLGARLLHALDEWSYSTVGITSVLTWLVKSNYWDAIDIQDFSTQVLKKALKGRFFMFLERMMALGFWFGDGGKVLETTAGELLASGGDKDVVDFLRRVGLVVDSVVDIEKGVFNFSAGVISKPLTAGFSGDMINGQHAFGGNNMGAVGGGFMSETKVFDSAGSTPFSFSATSIGDSRGGTISGSPKTVRPPSFGAAAMRGGASRSMTGGRRLGGR